MTRLRVATYNLYLGADLTLVFGATGPEDLSRRAELVRAQAGDTDFPSRAEAIAALLCREQVDVVGLQEVARWTRRPAGAKGETVVWCDFLHELLSALERAGTPYDPHAASASFSGEATVPGGETLAVSGRNVTLVRRGGRLRVAATRTGGYRGVLEIEAPMAGLRFRVPRSWGWVQGTVAGAPFRFVNTHTEAWDAAVRDAQRDELLEVLGGRDQLPGGPTGPPTALGGDFNAPPDTVGMPDAWLDAWAAAGAVTGTGHTCGQAPDLANPTSALHQRIDYVWLQGAAAEGCWVVGDRPEDRTRGTRLWPSDHACVVADVTF